MTDWTVVRRADGETRVAALFRRPAAQSPNPTPRAHAENRPPDPRRFVLTRKATARCASGLMMHRRPSVSPPRRWPVDVLFFQDAFLESPRRQGGWRERETRGTRLDFLWADVMAALMPRQCHFGSLCTKIAFKAQAMLQVGQRGRVSRPVISTLVLQDPAGLADRRG